MKIDPASIGVGLYQHDVKAKHLRTSLDDVVESCVNYVGVDVNTASPALLRYVSGLNQLTARRLYEYRREHGPFRSREQLREVPGFGEATFVQAAGFLKIPDGDNPLDATWIHPESYAVANRALERLHGAAADLRDKETAAALAERIAQVDLEALAKELEVGLLTLKDILAQLARPGRDPREDLPAPVFKRGVIKLEDLAPGMELTGTVLNVVDFGCFVDIGMHDSGLVHVSRLADKFVRDPHDVVAVGDIVKVWVMEIDKERRRVSLTMVRPGSERPKPPRYGGSRPERCEAGRAKPPSRRSNNAGRSAAAAASGKASKGGRPDSKAGQRPTAPAGQQGRPGGITARPAQVGRRQQGRPRDRTAAVGRSSASRLAASDAEAGDSHHRRHEERQGADADLRRPDAVLSAEAGGRRRAQPPAAAEQPLAAAKRQTPEQSRRSARRTASGHRTSPAAERCRRRLRNRRRRWSTAAPTATNQSPFSGRRHVGLGFHASPGTEHPRRDGPPAGGRVSAGEDHPFRLLCLGRTERGQRRRSVRDRPRERRAAHQADAASRHRCLAAWACRKTSW